jgi:hypothetical protein
MRSIPEAKMWRKGDLLPNGFEIDQKNVGETLSIPQDHNAANEEVPPLAAAKLARLFDNR